LYSLAGASSVPLLPSFSSNTCFTQPLDSQKPSMVSFPTKVLERNPSSRWSPSCPSFRATFSNHKECPSLPLRGFFPLSSRLVGSPSFSVVQILTQPFSPKIRRLSRPIFILALALLPIPDSLSVRLFRFLPLAYQGFVLFSFHESAQHCFLPLKPERQIAFLDPPVRTMPSV